MDWGVLEDVDVVRLLVEVGDSRVREMGVRHGQRAGVGSCGHEEEAAVEYVCAPSGMCFVWRVELAVVMMEGFGAASHVCGVGGAAPYLDFAGREGHGVFLLIEIGILGTGLGEYDGAGHGKEVVGFEVVEVPWRLGVEVHADGGFVAAVLRLPASAAPFQVLSGAQDAMRQHHADLASVSQVEVYDAREEEDCDFLIGGVSSSGPDVICVLAEILQFFTHDVRALVVSQPWWVADDGVDSLLGDDGWTHHVPQIVRPDVVASHRVQLSHLRCRLLHGIALETCFQSVGFENSVGVRAGVDGLREVEHQQVEAVGVACER